jgi:hypothetical protein
LSVLCATSLGQLAIAQAISDMCKLTSSDYQGECWVGGGLANGIWQMVPSNDIGKSTGVIWAMRATKVSARGSLETHEFNPFAGIELGQWIYNADDNSYANWSDDGMPALIPDVIPTACIQKQSTHFLTLAGNFICDIYVFLQQGRHHPANCAWQPIQEAHGVRGQA